MRILEQPRLALASLGFVQADSKSGWRAILPCLAVLSLGLTACNKDVATDAIQTDANGYLCLKCSVKLYTDRSVFIGPKCPQCNEESLMPVVGYYCEKDRHLSLRAARGDPQGAICERCQAQLVNAMHAPREKDLKDWGAKKVSP